MSEDPLNHDYGRNAFDRVEALIEHVEYNLGRLASMCERRNLSPLTQAQLRQGLEEELITLKALPQDITIRQIIDSSVEEAHFTNADTRWDVIQEALGGIQENTTL